MTNESSSSAVTSGAWYLLPTVVSVIVPLVTLPIFTRILTVEDYGVWALAVAYGVVASGAANLGLTIGYERNFFQHVESPERSGLLYSVLAFVFATTMVVGVATWIWRGELAAWLTGNPAHGSLVVVAYCANAVAGLKAYYLLYFKNMQQARLHAMYSVDESILGALVALVCVVWLRWGPMGLLAGQLAGVVLVLGLASIRVARDLPPAWSWPLLKDALAISLPLTPRVFVGVLGNHFDKYLLGQLSTMGAVGIYTIGQRLAYVVFQFMTALGNVFTPVIYRRMFSTDHEVRRSVGPYLTPFAWISAGIALAVALFAEEVLRMLAAPRYAGAAPVISLLALSYGVTFFGKVPQLTMARKTWIASVLSLVSVALNVAFNVFAVPRWGALGAAGGTLAAGIVSTVLLVVVGQRVFAVTWEARRLSVLFGLLALGALGAAWLPFGVPSYAARMGLKVLGVLAFVAVGQYLGSLSSVSRLARQAIGGRA